MQLAVCATEGRARMLAKGATAATPPGLLWRKVLSVSTAPPPQQSKEAGMGKGLRTERGSNGRDGRTLSPGAWQTQTSLSLQSSLGNRVPPGGPRGHSRNHPRSQRKTVKESTLDLWFSSLSPQ